MSDNIQEQAKANKKGVSASFTPFTISRVNEIAADEKRSFSLMCELLILEAIAARDAAKASMKRMASLTPPTA